MSGLANLVAALKHTLVRLCVRSRSRSWMSWSQSWTRNQRSRSWSRENLGRSRPRSSLRLKMKSLWPVSGHNVSFTSLIELSAVCLLLQKHTVDCYVTWSSCSWSTSLLLAGKYIHIITAVWAFSWVSYATLAYSTWVEGQGWWSTCLLEPWQCIFSAAADRFGFALYYIASGHISTGINRLWQLPSIWLHFSYFMRLFIPPPGNNNN